MSAEALYSPGKRAGPLGCLYERSTSTRADSVSGSPVQSTSSQSPKSSTSRRLLDAFKTSRSSNNSADVEPTEEHHRRRWRSSGTADHGNSYSDVPSTRDVASPPTAPSFKSGHRRAHSHSAATRHNTGTTRSLISKLTGSPKKSSQLALPDHEPHRFVIYEDAEGVSQEPGHVGPVLSPEEDEYDEPYNDENSAPAPGSSRPAEACASARPQSPQASTSASSSGEGALQVPASGVQRHSTPEDQIIDPSFAPGQQLPQYNQRGERDCDAEHEDPGPDLPAVKRPRIH